MSNNTLTDNLVLTGDLAVNGGDVTSTAATVNLFNTADTTKVNIGAEAAVDIGKTAKILTVKGLLNVDEAATFDSTARTTTATRRRCFDIPAQLMNPSGAGATWTEPSANMLGGWSLNADSAGETLIFNTRIFADWDGATNPTVDVYFAIPDAESDEDDAVLRLTSYYNAVGDSATKVQGTGAEGVVSTNTDGVQYQVYKATFTIDWDFADNVLEVGDNWMGVLGWEDTSTVLNVIIQYAVFSYATTHIGIESGDV